MTTALITGLGGFVASHLAEYLFKNTDWDIVGTMRWSEPLDNLELLAGRLNSGDRLSIAYCDLTDANSLNNTISSVKPDFIFHLAAQSYPQTSFMAPAETLQVNTVGTLNILEAVRREAPEAWVLNCSSSEVYGKVPPGLNPITEDCPFHPASPYAISKVGADMLGRFYAEAYGLRIITTRMFTHTGPRRGDVFAESSFAKQVAMIEAEQLDPPIKVGNLESLRTIADVRDAVRAYHMALTVNPIEGAVYNIGGSKTVTIGEMLADLCRLSSIDCEIEVDQSRLRPIDADNQVPNCDAFKARTNWEPVIPYEQTLADLLAYWRKRVISSVALQR